VQYGAIKRQRTQRITKTYDSPIAMPEA
jgi:hypothetical protein